MLKKLKKLCREPRLWVAVAASVAAIVLFVLIVISIKNSGHQDLFTPDPYTPPTDGPTGPTLEANPFSPEDFVYEGDYLTCLSTPAVLGIDVSEWQGNIDWAKVKDAGIRYAMIRLGYRGSTNGLMNEDEKLRQNYEGAKENGISVGFYFFSQAISVEEAVEEAEFVLERIKDWQVRMPIVYDWEYISQTARTANMDARTLTECTKAFCKTIEDAGYEAMVYFNESQSMKQMYLTELMDYRFWLAQYSHTMSYPYRVDMWQYTCEGSVPGITGNVDINLFFEYS